MSPQFETLLAFLVGLSFWSATLLIAAVMIRQARAWWTAAFPRGEARWFRTEIIDSHNGATTPLAQLEVTQVGRALLDSKTPGILFNDTERKAKGFAGSARVGLGDSKEVAVRFTTRDPMVWMEPSRFGVSLSPDEFTKAYAASKGAHGLKRTLLGRIGAPDAAWLRGHFESNSTFVCDAVSTLPPRGRAIRMAATLWLCALLTLVAAAGITWATLHGPREALQAKISGAIGLIFFLLVQPFGVWVRDRFAMPHQTRIDGLLQP